MDTTFDVDLEMGHSSRKSLRVASITDDYYGGHQADTSGPTQGGSAKSTDGEVVLVDHSYDYYTKSEKFDRVVLKSPKGHIESILLFIGLFSAAVTLFIIESYKKSSLDEQTVALLEHLSQPPVGISRDTPLEPPLFPNSTSFGSNSHAVWASTLWFLSLGLNVACAIWAILRWQRYNDLLSQSGEPQRARIRIYLSSSIGRRDLEPAVDAIWVLLHASVSLFFIGLIHFLFLINKTVACIVLGCIVPLALAYIAMTLLLHFLPDSQYLTHLTPPSSESWKVTQLDNQSARIHSPFCRPPPPGYVGEGKSLRDDHEHRDRQVPVAHKASSYS